jgi:anti-sigma regulatory factor (Ser/Thr protein kinase)
MQTKNDKSVELILANQLGFEKIAVACSASFAQLYGFPQDRIEDLKTMVGEAFSNAMQHGNMGRPDAKVKVSLQCKNNALVVRVIDEGVGIDTVPPVPVIDEIIEQEKLITGFGLFLIRQLADEVEFKKMTDKGHMVKMAINMKEQVENAEQE